MSAVRYGLALILVITLPALLLSWMLIHPFVHFWRRLGPVWTYSLVGGLIALAMMGLLLLHRALLAREFGTSYPLIASGVMCLVASLWMRLQLSKHVGVELLVGLPELDPERHPSAPVTEGLYAWVRHPRYVQVALALLGFTLIANYLAPYVIFALWLPVLYLIVRLEERELRERFGQAYEVYCRKVPRFMPRTRRRD
jgi:isoprenylcysteine carboxyl methyltransferase (ICMT) family protein YpbQ